MEAKTKIEKTLVAMLAAVKDDPVKVLKACEHPHHDDTRIGLGSITFYIGHKDDDDECFGCFAERMDDAYHSALERIWCVLAPLIEEVQTGHLSRERESVPTTELLVRMRIAWELAEDMLFAGGSDALTEVLAADEKEVTRRTKALDKPMRKLLGETGKRPKSSQEFTGKVGIVERYRTNRQVIEDILGKKRP
jgi:hypothetical protein